MAERVAEVCGDVAVGVEQRGQSVGDALSLPYPRDERLDDLEEDAWPDGSERQEEIEATTEVARVRLRVQSEEGLAVLVAQSLGRERSVERKQPTGSGVVLGLRQQGQGSVSPQRLQDVREWHVLE